MAQDSDHFLASEMSRIHPFQSTLSLSHRDLMAWLDKPFVTPPDSQDNPQADLAFA